MRPMRKALLAGAAVIALTGIAGLGVAAINQAHVIDVRLPDGSLAHIRYVGDTPPTVSVAPAPVASFILSPAFDPWDQSSPFAALDFISRAMDREAQAMFADASLPLGPAPADPSLMAVDLAKLPAGVRGFSMVSTLSGDGLCSTSVEYQSLGDGKPPKVVTHTSGPCAAGQTSPAPSAASASAHEPAQVEHDAARPI